MPCMDGGPSPEDERRDQQRRDAERQRTKELEAMLCEVCTLAAGVGQMALMPKTVQLWWSEHEAQDLQRMEELLLKRKQAQARLLRQRKQIDEELAKLK